jgi:hypothetical protein
LDGPLLEVVQAGPLSVPTRVFSAIALFALANGALINTIMASRILPAIAMVLIVSGGRGGLADTTVLLLLLVSAAVNAAVLVLRRDPVAHRHFRAPTAIPVIGAAVSVGLMTSNGPAVFARATDAPRRAGVALELGRGRAAAAADEARASSRVTSVPRISAATSSLLAVMGASLHATCRAGEAASSPFVSAGSAKRREHNHHRPPARRTRRSAEEDRRVVAKPEPTVLSSVTASPRATRSITSPLSATIMPKAFSCTAPMARNPKRLASTRSYAVGVPPRWV